MKEIILESPTVLENAAKPVADTWKKQRQHWTLTLFVSVGAGVVCAVAGLILGAISYLGFGETADRLNLLGNLMIIAAFPLMMLGAHALDKINELKQKRAA
ncbi:MAG TPA: hypothetical protein VIL74_01745 [Pyrinomonadaceae bacterium]|jgi:hypothetical protein